jgi:spermidine synthase
MVCHGELVKRRPGASHLTEFYLWMSLGGMLGGMFNVLLAPLLFNSVFEYPLMLVLACFLRPQQIQSLSLLNLRDILLPGSLLALFGIPVLMGLHPLNFGIGGVLAFFTILGLITYGFRHRPLRLGLGIAMVLVLATMVESQNQTLIRERSFFGVNSVQRTKTGEFNLLMHGNTIHGAQHTDPTRWKEPLTYYHQESPIGQLLETLNASRNLQQVGVMGLGSGTLACYRRPNQEWTYYEIDPSVVRLASDTRYFHYLSECGGDTEVKLGDGRLSLAEVSDGYYDLLIMDAFSSDAVPMHLITREALKLYLQKLTHDGIIAFNISNRNMDFSGVMGNLAADAQLVGWMQRFLEVREARLDNYLVSSDWVVMARSSTDLSFLDEDFRWTRLVQDPNTRVWTDDFSNIFGVLNIWSQ